jgi:DNA (cytosine-5)-methyltransferase 1
MRFFDLFSGIGGFALGAEWAGLRFDGHYFSEVDPYAIRVYTARFPDAVPLGDIRAIRGADLPAGDWIIAGGFPCQDISVAGKGAGLAGERSGLWYEYARIIGELRPRFAIMENVGALAFRGLDSVLRSLAALGYDAEWQDIRASDVGAPHRRERIWIVAYPEQREGKQRYQPSMLGRRSNETEQARLGCGDVSYPERDGVRLESGRGDGPGGAGTPEPCDDGAAQFVADSMRELCGAGRAGRPDSGDTRQAEQAHGQLADSSSERCGEARGLRRDESDERATGSGQALADSSHGGNVRRDGQLGAAQGEVRELGRSPQDGRREWWSTEPDVGRVAHGIPARVDRLKCLGNSIVPQIAERIFAQEVFDEWRIA